MVIRVYFYSFYTFVMVPALDSPVPLSLFGAEPNKPNPQPKSRGQTEKGKINPNTFYFSSLLCLLDIRDRVRDL